MEKATDNQMSKDEASKKAQCTSPPVETGTKIATTQHQDTAAERLENGILLKDMHPEEAPETQQRDQGKHVKTSKPAHAGMPEITQEQTHLNPYPQDLRYNK